jgi:hypothetical protein
MPGIAGTPRVLKSIFVPLFFLGGILEAIQKSTNDSD